MKILIVYDTQHGQCEKIGQAMADVARCLGHEASTQDVEFMAGHLVTSLWDAIIVGGPLHMGAHSHVLRDYIETNQAQLSMIPAAFFSVSLSAAGTEDQRDDARRCMDKFLESTGFQPLDRTILAGAVKYQDYGFFKRLLMKRVVGLAGGETDDSQNHEYTNWPEVSQFVERFVSRAKDRLNAVSSIESADQ